MENINNNDKAKSSPSYTRDQVRDFFCAPKGHQCLVLAEAYFKRPLLRSEMQTLMYILGDLGFEADLYDYLLEYCFTKGKKNIKYIHKVALSWADKGYKTREDIANAALIYPTDYYTIMRALNTQNSDITPEEATYIHRWLKIYNFSVDLVMDACRRAVRSTCKNRMAYTESILRAWLQKGIHTPEDVMRADNEFRQKKNETKNDKDREEICQLWSQAESYVDKYMIDSTELQTKLFFLLLLHADQKKICIQDLSASLSVTDDSILDALKYLQKIGYLSCLYDSDGIVEAYKMNDQVTTIIYP